MGFNRNLAISGTRWNNQLFVILAFLFRQQGHKRLFQIAGTGALQQFVGAAASQRFAVIHDHQMIKALRLIHVGAGDQHTHARPPLTYTPDQVPELAARQRVYPGGGLIQNQQVRVVYQCAAQTQFLLHAARQLARRTLNKVGQPGTRQQQRNALFSLLAALVEQAAKKIQVFAHAQRGIQVFTQALRHIGNTRTYAATMRRVTHVAIQHL